MGFVVRKLKITDTANMWIAHKNKIDIILVSVCHTFTMNWWSLRPIDPIRKRKKQQKEANTTQKKKNDQFYSVDYYFHSFLLFVLLLLHYFTFSNTTVHGTESIELSTYCLINTHTSTQWQTHNGLQAAITQTENRFSCCSKQQSRNSWFAFCFFFISRILEKKEEIFIIVGRGGYTLYSQSVCARVHTHCGLGCTANVLLKNRLCTLQQ